LLKIGIAGTPGETTLEGLELIPKLGLEAMEVEFTHGVLMNNTMAKRIGEKSKIHLSAHGPYYINLNSKEAKKIAESEQRILKSAERAHYMHADPVVFHPGFYSGKTPEKAYGVMRQELDDLVQTMNADEWSDVRLAPETTGKKSQFGSFEELVDLCCDVEGLWFTLDWAHVWARDQGKVKFETVLDKIVSSLGKKFLKKMHMHFAGVEFTKAGEKRHLLLEDSKFPWKNMVQCIKEYKIQGTLICESPDPVADAQFIHSKLVR